MTSYQPLSLRRLHELLASTASTGESGAEPDDSHEDMSSLLSMLVGALPSGKDLPAVLKPTILRLETPEEVSLLVLVLLAYSCKSNQKDGLLDVVRQAVAERTGGEPGWAAILEHYQDETFVQGLATRFERHAELWPFQRLGVKRTGGLDLSMKLGPAARDKAQDKLLGLKEPAAKDTVSVPSVRNDDARLAAILAGQATPAGLVAMIPSTDEFLQRLRDACWPASHPAKLSSVHGASGLIAAAQAPDLDAPGCVSEFDYQTLQTEALVAPANLQAFTNLTIALVVWAGAPVRLRSLLQQDAELRAFVGQHMQSLGVTRAAEILDAYLNPDMPSCEGAPPVFVVVQGGDRPEVSLLSVLSPYSHMVELLEARTHLAHLRIAQAEENSEAALRALDVQHAQELAAVPQAKREKLEAAQARDRKKLKGELERTVRVAPFVPVPHRSLMVGGSTPRNVVGGLTIAHHNANLAPVISLDRSIARRRQPGRLVHTPQALVRAPYLHRIASKKLAADKAARQVFFAGLIEEALAPLLGLRDAYAQQMSGRLGLPAFTAQDLEHLRGSSAAWALFIRGNDELKRAEWRELLLPLAERVVSRVQDAIHKVEDGALNEFHGQLLQQSCDFLMFQHA